MALPKIDKFEFEGGSASITISGQDYILPVVHRASVDAFVRDSFVEHRLILYLVSRNSKDPQDSLFGDLLGFAWDSNDGKFYWYISAHSQVASHISDPRYDRLEVDTKETQQDDIPYGWLLLLAVVVFVTGVAVVVLHRISLGQPPFSFF
jgi:hypothetical protein